MVKFLVKINGTWTRVDQGGIAPNGRSLLWSLNGETGTAGIGQWRLAPETIANSSFKNALWSGLDDELRAAAIERRPGLIVLAVTRKRGKCDAKSTSLALTR